MLALTYSDTPNKCAHRYMPQKGSVMLQNECVGANTPTFGQFGPSSCPCSDLVPQAYAGGPANGTCMENKVRTYNA